MCACTPVCVTSNSPETCICVCVSECDIYLSQEVCVCLCVTSVSGGVCVCVCVCVTSNYLRRPGCVLHFSVVEETGGAMLPKMTQLLGGRACADPKPTLYPPPRPLLLPLTSALRRGCPGNIQARGGSCYYCLLPLEWRVWRRTRQRMVTAPYPHLPRPVSETASRARE